MRTAIPTLCVLMSACASVPHGRHDVDRLEEEILPLFTSVEVLELAALEPQLELPFRLGIAPPIEVQERGTGAYGVSLGERRVGFGAWSAADERRLRSWSQRFVEAGWIDDVVFLPGALIGNLPAESATGSDLLLRVRAAAARAHVDAVLVTQAISASDGSATAWSLLDLTLIGAAVVPAYEIRSRTVIEGVLIDTRNEYLYATARGTHEEKGHAAAVEIDRRLDRLSEQTRGRAIDQLAQRLLDEGQRAATAAVGRADRPASAP